MEGGTDAQMHGLMHVCMGAQCTDGGMHGCTARCTCARCMDRQMDRPARARQSPGVPVALQKWKEKR